jgi:U3 small nucleolar RNA-associated protein 7
LFDILLLHPIFVVLISPGVDCQVKVWDVRTFKPLHAYFANSPAMCLDISQRGILGVAQGRRLQLWRDSLSDKATSPYLTHILELGGIRKMRFCPYEDVLGIGCAGEA